MPTAVEVIYLTDKLTVFSGVSTHTGTHASSSSSSSSFIPSPYIVIGDCSGDIHVIKISHEFGIIQDAGIYLYVYICDCLYKIVYKSKYLCVNTIYIYVITFTLISRWT